MHLEFNDIITHLTALYRLGVLVPFIGSGMSLETCTNWQDLLAKLAKQAGMKVPKALNDEKPPEANVIYRLADEIVTTLRSFSYEERAGIYRNALLNGKSANGPTIPEQTRALATLFWPLVISTNYDDLYWSSTSPNARPTILGRSVEDCHRVLRSLDENTAPVLWALQGFLGGQVEKEEVVIQDEKHRRELFTQMVVGHQQYQRAINAEGHFRRAFAEVFRRRSFLFLGSGLLEDYLLNLFSEIIHHHGVGAYPHFALIASKDKDRFDSTFLQSRLGIIPVLYNKYEDLPGHLHQFSNLVNYWPGNRRPAECPSAFVAHFDEIGLTLAANPFQPTPSPFKVSFCKSRLPLPARDRECSLVSVGRNPNNTPRDGEQSAGLFRKAKESQHFTNLPDWSWMPIDEAPSYVYRSGHAPVFAVAARHRSLRTETHDRRDLGIIPEAVCSALVKIDEANFETVNIGPVASGKHRPWHPIHPFAQTLRGIRLFLSKHTVQNIKRVNLFIVDQAVWYPLMARKIPIIELLSSGLTRHRIESRDADGNSESISMTLKDSPTLEQLLKLCKIDRNKWNVAIQPRPTDEKGEEEPKNDLTITPTMTVVVTAVHKASEAGHSPGTTEGNHKGKE